MSSIDSEVVDGSEGGLESAIVVNESDLVVLGDGKLLGDCESELFTINGFEGPNSQSDILPGFNG